MEGLVEEEFRMLTLTVNKIWVPSLAPVFDSLIHTEQVSSPSLRYEMKEDLSLPPSHKE